MDEKDKKIEELKRQLDDLLTEKYLNQKGNKYNELIRKELEILVKGLYRDCKEFLKEPETPVENPAEMVKNIIKAIDQFSKDYNWPLGE